MHLDTIPQYNSIGIPIQSIHQQCSKCRFQNSETPIAEPPKRFGCQESEPRARHGEFHTWHVGQVSSFQGRSKASDLVIPNVNGMIDGDQWSVMMIDGP